MHDVVLGCISLNREALLRGDQVLLVKLLLKLAHLRLQLNVLTLHLDELHLVLAGLALNDAVGRVNRHAFIELIHNERAPIVTLVEGRDAATIDALVLEGIAALKPRIISISLRLLVLIRSELALGEGTSRFAIL